MLWKEMLFCRKLGIKKRSIYLNVYTISRQKNMETHNHLVKLQKRPPSWASDQILYETKKTVSFDLMHATEEPQEAGEDQVDLVFLDGKKGHPERSWIQLGMSW